MTARSTSAVWSRGAALCCSTVTGPLQMRPEDGLSITCYNLSNSSARRSFPTNMRASSPWLRVCYRSGTTARWIMAGSPRRLTCVSGLSSAPFSSRNWWNLPGRFASCLSVGIFAPKYGSTHLTTSTASRACLRTSGSATLCSIPFRFRRFWNGWLPPRCLRDCLKPSDKT